MSKFVNDIIAELKLHPDLFKDYKGEGVEKNNTIVSGFGNTALLSVVKVKIGGVEMPTSYIDNFKLERAIKKWYRSVSLHKLRIDKL